MPWAWADSIASSADAWALRSTAMVRGRFGQAWRRFAPTVEGWVDVTVSAAPQDLAAVWAEVLAGASDPRTGHVLQA